MHVRVCSGEGDSELVFVPPGAAVFRFDQTGCGVDVDETIHDFVGHADLVWRSPGRQVLWLELSHQNRGS